jgi:hypothetical protein
MLNTTMNNGHTQRKTLATQLDRLDVILDGLANALNESVADAVRGVVGQVVKESVEATIREVLGNPDLLSAALARHAPPPPPPAPAAPPAPPRRTLRDTLQALLASLVRVAGTTAAPARRKLGTAWSWVLGKLQTLTDLARRNYRRLTTCCMTACGTAALAAGFAWQFRRPVTVAVGVGLVSGTLAYFAGPLVAGFLGGLGGTAATAAGMAFWPLARLLRSDTAG